MTRKNLIAVISVAVCFVALLIVATFYDLEISLAIGNADSVFGQFFNYLGETPAYAGMCIACVILYRAVGKQNKFYKFLKPALFVCVLVAFSWFAAFIMDEMFVELKWSYLYMAVFGIVGAGLALAATRNAKKETMEKLVIFAVLILACLAISQFLVTVLKYIWSRQRFRNLQAGNTFGGDTVGFSPWYLPQLGKHDPDALYSDVLGGKDDSGAYKSFPSGHTAAAGISFAVIILPELFASLRKYKVWFYVLPSVYTVLVALSRIVNRAHYLSDVLFGGLIGVGSIFLVSFILKKMWLKYNWCGADALRINLCMQLSESDEQTAEKEEEL